MPSPKVLIIDDDRQVSLALSVRLGASGYEVAAAYDGESGLAHLGEHPVDVVLLDVRMPGIDGIEVVTRMRRDPKLADIPVVFISANAQERVRRAAMNAGGTCFIEKPFNAQKLLETLEHLLATPGAPARLPGSSAAR